MAQIRRPLIGVLALFAGAIALDRIGLEAGEDVVATHAYVLALAFTAAPLLVPAIRRASRAAVIAIAIGSAVAWTLLSGGPDVGVHVAFVGLAFIALATGLGHVLASALASVDETVATAASGENPALDLEGATAAAEIQTEIARSRRHDRPLSITVLTPTTDGLKAALGPATIDIDRAIRTRFLFGSLARTVSQQLRRSDLLFEHRRAGRFVVLSPETDEAGAGLLVRRVIDAAARTGIAVVAGSATFPDDGIGFESLLDHAEAQMAAAEVPRLQAVDRGSVA